MAVSWCWVGAIETDAAGVTARATSGSDAKLRVSTSSDLSGSVDGTEAAIDGNGFVRMTIDGLQPGTQYHYGVVVDDVLDAYRGAFRTAPDGAANVSFGFGSCSDTGVTSVAYGYMVDRDPDLFFQIGDFHYEDPASAADMRSGIEAQFNKADEQADLMGTTPSSYTWSDHDWSADNNGDGTSPYAAAVQGVYRQIAQFHTLPSATGIYHTFVWGRVRFIVTDNRSFKSPNEATDNSSKTVLGATQKTWFKNLIDNTDEPLVIWVQELPWNGAASSPDDEWFAYDTERQEIADHIETSGRNVVILAGDMHALAADDGTNSPGGIPILHAAPLAQTTSTKAGPYSEGSPYTGSTRQYGWVDITDDGGTLIELDFTGYDSSNVSRVTLHLEWTVDAEGPPSGSVSGTHSWAGRAGTTSGEWSGIVSGTTEAFPAPTGLLAVAVSPTEIDLTWDEVPGVSGYDIERDGTVIVFDHPTTGYADSGLTPETTYVYRVRAVE